ncbi:NB-ARC domain-containing protein [Favolaschia claudopus]|uniref:NB-ARC domain-containing protein n=1 Tax=Favolaschia claudopus TaxID=2862362 RepID=A0AAW0DQV7_9AGAR
MPTRNIAHSLEYTSIAANALRGIALATEIPFLSRACELVSAIIPMVEHTRMHKERCTHIVEQIHQSLCALTALCVGTELVLAPKMIHEIAQFASILEKLQLCLEAQNDIGPLRRFFRQNELTFQLNICEKGLQAAFEAFKMETMVEAATDLVQFHVDLETRHQAMLELISAQSISFDDRSLVHIKQRDHSSGSLSLLPASPKLFHGREAEFDLLVSTLLSDNPRAVILGPGGIGKTTLAMALLHFPAILEKYNNQHFISCESSSTCSEMITTLGLHLQLEPSRQLQRMVIRHLQQCESSLIVLDNLETPWEGPESRGEVEELLSSLADIPGVGLLVTMRGTERPAKVKWSRPFLLPLEPLSSTASRQIFLDIADEPEIGEESALDQLLNLSDNHPLAITLLANVASFEGYATTLERWQIENFTLLSLGHDKGSSLEKSITLSIHSPQFKSFQPAQDLLSLLSLLPDGIKDKDLQASKVSIPNMGQCQSFLLRMSLAYRDPEGRLRALSPIREFIHRVHPPSQILAASLRLYFQDLLDVWLSTRRQLFAGNRAVITELVGNLGNVNSLLLEGMITEDKSTLVAIGASITVLDIFSEIMMQGSTLLVQRLPHLVRITEDVDLRLKYGRRLLCNRNPKFWLGENPKVWIQEGLEYFNTGNTYPIDQAATFYNTVAWYYIKSNSIDRQKATEYNKLALDLVEQTDNTELQLLCFDTEIIVAEMWGDRNRQLKVINKAYNCLAKIGSTMNLSQCDLLVSEAWVQLQLGNLPRTLRLCIEANEILIVFGMQKSDRYLEILNVRAEVHFNKSEYLEARQLYQEMISLISFGPFYANALISLAHTDLVTGGPVENIQENLNKSERVYKALDNDKTVISVFLLMRGLLDILEGNIDDARSRFLCCLAESREYRPDIHSLSLAVISDSRHKLYDVTETFNWAVVSFAFVRKMDDVVGTWNALQRLADAVVDLADDETAFSLFQVALEGGTQIDIHLLRARCMIGIGDIMFRKGIYKQAQSMWKEACPLLVRSSQMEEVDAVNERLGNLQSI